MNKPTLVIGRVETQNEDDYLIPLHPEAHVEVALEHQRKLAALIAAAYLYQEERSAESLVRLAEAADGL